jgi:O-antigen/teichoic acid export membrane protein
MVVTVMVVTAGFVSSTLLNRWLGPTRRGELGAALIVAQLLPYIASMGLSTAVVYHASPLIEGPVRALSTAIPIGLVQAAVFGALCYSLMPTFLGSKGPDVVLYGRVALISLCPSILALYLQSTYQAQQQFKAFNLLRALLPFSSLLAIVLLGLTHHVTVGTVVLVYTFAPFAVVAVAVVCASRSHYLTSAGISRSVGRRLIGYGAKAQAGDLANSLNFRLDQLVIAAWLPARELGLYIAAVSATQLGNMISLSLSMVVQPALLNVGNDVGRRRVLLRRALRNYTIAGGATLVVVSALCPLVIPLLFGAAFGKAVAPSEILVTATFVLGYKTILAAAAQALGDPWLASRAELTGLLVTALGLIILIPILGITGAAITSLVAYATQGGVLARGLRHRLTLATPIAPAPVAGAAILPPTPLPGADTGL